MQIALFGFGKMGRIIQERAQIAGCRVVAIIDPTAPEATHREISKDALIGADLCIDFSHPTAVIPHSKIAAALQKPLIIGTTGWYKDKELLHNLLIEHKTKAIYAENFAKGLQLFLKIVQYAASLINQASEFDVSIIDEHHRQKVDAPSGTAESLAAIIINGISHKKEVVTSLPKGALAKEKLQVASIRNGHQKGRHTLLFSSPLETITLVHETEDRAALADGALLAAKHIDKAPIGLSHFRDLL